MVFQPQILHKPEHSGRNPECIIVYFYELTNMRDRELVKNFADLPIPIPNGDCDCSRPGSPKSPEVMLYVSSSCEWKLTRDEAIVSFSEPPTPPAFLEPPVDLAAPENKLFQHTEGPVNKFEWLADIAELQMSIFNATFLIQQIQVGTAKNS